MTLAMLILFAGSLWLLSERQRLQNQIETANRERDAAQSRAQQGTALEKELARAKSQNQELDEKLRQSKKDLDEARQNLARTRQQSRSPSILDSVLSMVLAPSVAGRGSERLDEFVLLPEARTAHLQLLTEPGVEGKYFRAEIRPRNGDVIFNRDRLRLRRTSSGTGLRFSLPAARLQNGIYEVSLYSDENKLLSTYEFRITRRF